MAVVTFESKLLADGHLHCPKELAAKNDARFRATVVYGSERVQASSADIELAAVEDASEDSLSQDELSYYLSLPQP